MAGVPGHPDRSSWRVVGLDGELDLATAPLLGALLLASVTAEPPVEGIVVDMSGVEFADVAGISALLVVRGQLTRAGRGLVVRDPALPVARLLGVLGEDGVIEGPEGRGELRYAC